MSTDKLWHKRLGHPLERNLSYLSKVCGFTCSSSDVECCDVCHRAKQTPISFPLSGPPALTCSACNVFASRYTDMVLCGYCDAN